MSDTFTTESVIELQTHNNETSQSNWQASTAPSDPDSIIEQSRAADATVPEGGYGWVVLFGCGVITFWFVGTTYCWGVIQGALVKEGLASPSTLAFVGSLTVAFIAILAIPSARVVRALGARNTGLLAISCLAAGELLSGFTTKSVGGLFVTAGIVMGVGVSMAYMVVSATPAQYFSRRRGLANGIVFACGGIGGAVISFAMDGLLQKLGPAWTFRVIGFVTLATGLPAAWLVKERTPIRNRALIDRYLFRDIKFLVLFITGAIGTFPLFVPPFFLPLYSASLGMSASTGAGLVAGFNFSSAIGRIGFGFVSDMIGPLNSLFIALLLSALSMLALWPVSSSLGPLIAFVIINGAANGGFFSLTPTVVASLFGSARVSVAMGMIVTGWTGGYLLGAPIAGYILNAYGGQSAGFEAYRPAIYYAGSMALGAAALAGFVRLRVSRRLLKKA
ncbi:putative monocarboxylate transporter [Rhizodiscina lignyota]|uniref:Monocarboxylate transporter n=1 Tax=Rhizodiscina lignyota TaxID=1504668 RepID=A0A9P4ID00_9PEZI|nr:putative monocarboxylate transporter [Rhizodiscina lignyota]